MHGKTKEEIDSLIAQLRGCIRDLILDNQKFDNDFYLYRWLLQNGLKVDRTEKAIRASIVWRKANGIDELAETEYGMGIPGLKHITINHFDGFTKMGQPLITSDGEGIDTRAIFQKFGKENLRKHFLHYFVMIEKTQLEHYKDGPPLPTPTPTQVEPNKDEEIIAKGLKNLSTRENLKPKTSGYNPSWDEAASIQIVSYKNFSLLNATHLEGVQVFHEMVKCGFTYFPALCSALYIVNLNRFSKMVMKALRPLLVSDAFTMDFFDTDVDKWGPVLLELIDADQLSQKFGGTKADSPKC